MFITQSFSNSGFIEFFGRDLGNSIPKMNQTLKVLVVMNLPIFNPRTLVRGQEAQMSGIK